MENQFERVRSLLSRITYKTGWSLSACKNTDIISSIRSKPKIDTDNFEGVLISIMTKVKDANDHSQEIKLGGFICIDTLELISMDDNSIVSLIFSKIMDIEFHEFHEWLKFYGVPVYDPHPKLKEKTA